MKKESGIKTKTIILIAIMVIISLFIVRILINDELFKKKTDINNQTNNNDILEEKEEMEKITLNDFVIKELINLLDKSEGSLTESKILGSGIPDVEELMYYVEDSDVSRLDSKIIMYLVLNNANLIKVESGYISSNSYGVGYEIGYIIENIEVQKILKRIFGSNLLTMPNNADETEVYFVNIDGIKTPKYARYNVATGNVEISLNNVITSQTSNYMYLNNYDRVDMPDDNTLELYEKVIFTSGITDKDNDNGFKLYKDIALTEYIAKVNNYTLINGKYRFSEKELNNYINLFAEYKYTFNKDEDGFYHLKSIKKMY